MNNSPNSDPIIYEDAFRELLAKRRRRRFSDSLKRFDPRPTSPTQVLLLGLAFVFIGWLLPIAHLAMVAGLALLAVGFVSGLIQPRSRQVVWRGRTIDLAPEETWATRLYRTLYRSP